MSDINVKKAPGRLSVVPFFGTAALAFLALCIMLFFSADAFKGHYFHPKLLALVHTAALGWGTMVIFGAVYQLLPVIFEKELHSTKLAIASYLLLLPGVVLLIYNFWMFTPNLSMQLGGVLVLLSIILFALNVLNTAEDSTKYTIQKSYIIASALWLFITALVGLLLVLNFSYPIFKQDHLGILKLHAHAGIVGWFLMLIIGVGTKLIPMFLLGKSSKENYLKWAFYLINIGLAAFLIDGFFSGVQMRSLIYAAAIVAGIVFFLLYVFDAYKNRMRKKLDFNMKHTMFSMILLLLAIIHLPIIVLKQNQLNCAMVYGTLIFMGWITSLILGKTFKTLPFIVWNDHYKNHSGKPKIPMPKHLFFESWVKWQFFIYLAGLIIFIIGIKTGFAWLIQIAAVVMIAVAVIYNINVFKIILHKPNLKTVEKI